MKYEQISFSGTFKGQGSTHYCVTTPALCDLAMMNVSLAMVNVSLAMVNVSLAMVNVSLAMVNVSLAMVNM